ncbi:hypothetical protein A2617_00455 [Candidatus Daviesbacteria bacterium RIFOXYD1_FULL_41_10]|uniref:Uncharacterized protein n=1 Tax=Candidatus Daviesbacteria bacterium RIFOXYD1_FULL_41_10 TaxID=1797801 RepID=A0A1F5N041_9BACT|nr:MAG: hypothetical protein A2617_00455 [Candidatus Daviesbacteria bacterium RIFOXYD1_FULL_41_10]
MKISILKKESRVLHDFNDVEWRSYNQEYYGKGTEWKSGKCSIVARDGKRIVGLARLQNDGGVLYLKSIVVV